jgi:hypothetical protein
MKMNVLHIPALGAYSLLILNPVKAIERGDVVELLIVEALACGNFRNVHPMELDEFVTKIFPRTLHHLV